MSEHSEDLDLDAYGHMNWTVGNEDWVACFDARRNGDHIEYHVVIDCESGGFVDTVDHDTIALQAAVEGLHGLPYHYADLCLEHYADKRGRQYRVSVRETRKTAKAWEAHIAALVAQGPCSEADPCGVCSECNEPGPDPIRDGWIGSDGRP